MNNLSIKQKTFVVYKHTSPSGKSYIGITRNYKKRCRYHQYKSSCCTAFLKAINKYGWDNFTHEILASGLTLHSANHFEEFYIKHLNTVSPNGYNLRTGGDGFTHNEETKEKLRSSRTGKKHTPESIAKMIAVKLGKKHTPETIAKMRDSHSGDKCNFFGKFGADHNLSKTYKITSPDGIFEVVDGIKDFCRKNGLHDGAMSAVANGKRKHHKGYKCEHYIESILI